MRVFAIFINHYFSADLNVRKYITVSVSRAKILPYANGQSTDWLYVVGFVQTCASTYTYTYIHSLAGEIISLTILRNWVFTDTHTYTYISSYTIHPHNRKHIFHGTYATTYKWHWHWQIMLSKRVWTYALMYVGIYVYVCICCFTIYVFSILI